MKASLILVFAVSACASWTGCDKSSDPLQVQIPPTGSGGQAGASAGGSGGASGTGGQPSSAVDTGTPPKPDTGVACGPKICPAGQTCCNASCGICTPPGNACIQIACDPPKPDAGAGGGACQTDSDCRLFDDYCTGCDCRALAKGEPDPKCSGPGVRCFAAPCMKKTAACVAGHCAVR